MKPKLTYRQFDRLVDVLFLLNLLYVAQALFDMFGTDRAIREGTAGPVAIAFILIELATRTGSMAIIFWSGLRDEYAERLWRRSAITFTKLILATPWIFAIVALGTYLAGHPIRSWLPQDPSVSIVFNGEQRRFSRVSVHELDGISSSIGWLWTYARFLFIALYKWYRWRDGK